MNLFRFLPLLILAFNFTGSTPAPRVAPGNDEDLIPAIHREEDDQYIPWMKERRLVWGDFMSAPRRGTEAVASTSTSLGISYQVQNGVLVYHVTCNFSKQRSWGLLKTDYILAHEQAHFDITEIHARKLYRALLDYSFNEKSFKRDINAIYHDMVKEKENMQAAYDRESDHSRNRLKQFEWEERIRLMLEETEPWASYP